VTFFFVADDVDVLWRHIVQTGYLLLKVIAGGHIDMLSFSDIVDTTTADWTIVSSLHVV